MDRTQKLNISPHSTHEATGLRRVSVAGLTTGGFTIVEVLVVLSIASLIMLVVFMAVPQLQRSARNNQRNADGNKVLTAVNECLSNNNGILSTCLPSGSSITTPSAGTCLSGSTPIIGCSGGTLDVTKLQQLTTVNIYIPATVPAFPSGTSANSTINVYGGYTCSGNTAVNTVGGVAVGLNQFAAIYNREGGGGASLPACQNP